MRPMHLVACLACWACGDKGDPGGGSPGSDTAADDTAADDTASDDTAEPECVSELDSRSLKFCSIGSTDYVGEFHPSVAADLDEDGTPGVLTGGISGVYTKELDGSSYVDPIAEYPELQMYMPSVIAGDWNADGHADMAFDEPSWRPDEATRTHDRVHVFVGPLPRVPHADDAVAWLTGTVNVYGYPPTELGRVPGVGADGGDGVWMYGNTYYLEYEENPYRPYVALVPDPEISVEVKASEDVLLVGGGDGLEIRGERAGVLDADGDGVVELLVASAGATTGYSRGYRVRIIDTTLRGGVFVDDFPAITQPTGWQMLFGDHTTGDLNLDGYDDLAIREESVSDSDESDVMIYFGPLAEGGTGDWGAQVLGSASFRFGNRTVLFAGDIDGDGVAADLVVSSAIGEQGSVYMVPGPIEGTVALQDSAAALGPEYFGELLSPAGDVDGDGCDDLFVSAGDDGDYYNALWLLYGGW